MYSPGLNVDDDLKALSGTPLKSQPSPSGFAQLPFYMKIVG